MQRIFSREVPTQVGQEVILTGWVQARRNMGKIIFLDLRDREGTVQIVGVPQEMSPESLAVLQDVRLEYVVTIRGLVKERGEKQKNPAHPTGTVEVLAKEVTLLAASGAMPFEVDGDTRTTTEALRLKYRYLDLRSERMRENLRRRHNVNQFLRTFFSGKGFFEVETPYLTKGTPEGSREFIVPSRLHAGEFYVLPQSPQQFKQLLMVGGIERYFQIARCFRDEDQRGDRQPEFTQCDVEMSFVEQKDVMAIIEELMIALIKTVTPEKRIQTVPFPRLTYQEAMAQYGSDKPDLREDKNDPNLLALCWIVDFPFFEKDDQGGWQCSHNPFSSPKPEHREWLMEKKNIGEILTTQYDLAMNGWEIWGGSIRNHRPEALKKVFEVIGLSEEEIQSRFGHMLEALSFGAPPHGGIAAGLDRIIAILSGEANIREVIAFPKTGDARDLMMQAPSQLPDKALSDVHIKRAE